MNNSKIIHLKGQFRPVVIGHTILVLMVIFGVGCNQPTPIPTPTPTPEPMWSEAEAIAVVKNWCYQGNWPNLTICERELSTAHDQQWRATYQPEEKRWAVSIMAQKLFGGSYLHIVSYVYENTQTVEWYVNK